MPKRITSFAERPIEKAAMIRLPGQEGQADLERAVPEHELEVERGEEEPREHRAGPEDADDVRDREVAQPEKAERHERRADPRLDHEEDREQQRRQPRAGRASER